MKNGYTEKICPYSKIVHKSVELILRGSIPIQQLLDFKKVFNTSWQNNMDKQTITIKCVKHITHTINIC